MAVWLHTRLVCKLSQKVCPIYISLHAVSNVFFFSTMVGFGGLAYETNYRPSYVPRSITPAYFGSERRGLYERIPLSFANVAVLVHLSNSSPVASALPIYNYD